MFDVSEMTVRRDLDLLERKGLLRRLHGLHRVQPGGDPGQAGHAAAGQGVTVVADASRFSHVAFTAIAPLQAVNRIIGETGITAETAQAIEALGVELMIV